MTGSADEAMDHDAHPDPKRVCTPEATPVSSPERDTQIEKGKDRDSSFSSQGRVTDEMIEAAADAWLQAFYALEDDEEGLEPWAGTVQDWRDLKVFPALPCVDGPDAFLALIRTSRCCLGCCREGGPMSPTERTEREREQLESVFGKRPVSSGAREGYDRLVWD